MPRYDAKILTQSRHMADIFEETARRCGQPKKASNWLMGETMRILKEKGMDPEKISFTPTHLADLILALERKEINQQGAKQVFEQIMEKDVDPLAYMKERGLLMVSDDGAYRSGGRRGHGGKSKDGGGITEAARKRLLGLPGGAGDEKDERKSGSGKSQCAFERETLTNAKFYIILDRRAWKIHTLLFLAGFMILFWVRGYIPVQ